MNKKTKQSGRHSHRARKRVFVYIDGNNLHQGILSLGWELGYAKFYRWLQDKYRMTECFIFLGYVKEYEPLYKTLRQIGYRLEFKDISFDDSGKRKGNVDSDLVQKVNEDFMAKSFAKFILVSADGDYARMINYYKQRGVFEILLAPCNEIRGNNDECGLSYLLRKLNIKIHYLGNQKNLLAK